MSESYAFNRDCLEAMREFPDKFFDLACVDPPYGGGCSQNSNVERERERELHGAAVQYKGAIVGRFGGRFERYHIGNTDGRDVGGEVQPSRGCL